jgi:hypothetical protein
MLMLCCIDRTAQILRRRFAEISFLLTLELTFEGGKLNKSWDLNRVVRAVVDEAGVLILQCKVLEIPSTFHPCKALARHR